MREDLRYLFSIHCRGRDNKFQISPSRQDCGGVLTPLPESPYQVNSLTLPQQTHQHVGAE